LVRVGERVWIQISRSVPKNERHKEQRSRILPGNIAIEHTDSALHIPELMQRIPSQAYVLTFADIEGIKEWPWSAVEALQAQGHGSVDLVMLFPLQITLNRLISYQERHRERYAASLTTFFGTDTWRQIAQDRITDARAAEFRARITDLYLTQLRREFRYARELRDVRQRGGRVLYRLLFASNHEAGDRIADWARGLTEGQRQLDLDLF
jgi:three-Cys-motif partner protein